MDLVIFEGVFLWLIWISGGVLLAPQGCLRVGRNSKIEHSAHHFVKC